MQGKVTACTTFPGEKCIYTELLIMYERDAVDLLWTDNEHQISN